MKPRETDVALGIAALLEQMRWSLFYEVECPHTRRWRADIVAEKDGDIMVVEVQTRLDSRLLWECERWSFYTHYVCAAYSGRITPQSTRLHFVAAAAGIGILHAQAGLLVDPELKSAAGVEKLRAKLLDQNRRMTPGAPGGHRVTALSIAQDQLMAHVKAEPGQELSYVLVRMAENVQTDADTQRRLAWLVCHGKVSGVLARRFGTSVLLYPR